MRAGHGVPSARTKAIPNASQRPSGPPSDPHGGRNLTRKPVNTYQTPRSKAGGASKLPTKPHTTEEANKTGIEKGGVPVKTIATTTARRLRAISGRMQVKVRQRRFRRETASGFSTRSLSSPTSRDQSVKASRSEEHTS